MNRITYNQHPTGEGSTYFVSSLFIGEANFMPAQKEQIGSALILGCLIRLMPCYLFLDDLTAILVGYFDILNGYPQIFGRQFFYQFFKFGATAKIKFRVKGNELFLQPAESECEAFTQALTEKPYIKIK